MLRGALIIFFFTAGIFPPAYAQKHLSRQLDSLEREFRELDSIHSALEIKSADLEDMIRDHVQELDQAEAELQKEMEEEKRGGYLSIAMTVGIVLLFILGMIWLFKNKQSRNA